MPTLNLSSEGDALEIERMYFPVKSLGPGKRFVIWTSGCPRRCENCSNPELQKRNPLKDISVKDILKAIDTCIKDIDGITITGGDPLFQPDELINLLDGIKALGIKDVLVYTGYIFEEIEREGGLSKKAAELCGVIIDGEYIDSLNDNKGIRGSSNQRIIVIDKSLEEKYKGLDSCPRTSEMIVAKNRIFSAGIPLKTLTKEICSDII